MERPTGNQACVVFDAQITNLSAIRHFVTTAAEAADFSREAIDGMVLAVDEAATNVIFHGYRGSPGVIEVELKADANALIVRLRDEAPAFDPTSVPAPNLDIPLDLRPPGGLGVYLMRQFVDRISYQRTESGQNELTLEILAPQRRGAESEAETSADVVGRIT